MKKIKFNFTTFLSIFCFWLVFFMFFLLALFLGKHGANYEIDYPGYIGFYLLFIHPILFFIPVALSKMKRITSNLLLALFFLVIPYIFIYVYVYNALRESFGHISW